MHSAWRAGQLGRHHRARRPRASPAGRAPPPCGAVGLRSLGDRDRKARRGGARLRLPGRVAPVTGCPGHRGVPTVYEPGSGPVSTGLTPAERGHRAEQDRRSWPASAARLERPGPAPVAGWAAGRSVPSQRSDAPSERAAPRLAPERQRDERLEARWRAWRSARARIVSVGLAWPPLGKVELPASQRLATP